MGPGNCPICGMALEPVIATGTSGESAELRDMTRRFWIGLVLSLPVLALEMGGAPARHQASRRSSDFQSDPDAAGNARRALGRLALLRAGVGLHPASQPQHVHAHCHGHGCGLDLMGIVRARKLSHATMKNIRQNLFLSFAYNVAGIPVAAGVLYPFFGLLLSPIVAAAAMALSSVSVIANALRLRAAKVD